MRKKAAILFFQSMKFQLLFTAIFAHFEMLRPIPRVVGEMEEQVIFPCAGAIAPANRAPFLIQENSIELAFYWDGDVDVYFGFGENPDTFPFKVGSLFGAIAGQTYTVLLDFSDIPGLSNGKFGTIQAICHQPKVDNYQCADVILTGVPIQVTSTTAADHTTQVSSLPSSSATSVVQPPTPTAGALLQKLTKSLTGHLIPVNGCNKDEEHMGPTAPSKNFAALWLRAVFHDVGKFEPGKPVAGLLPFFLDESENFGIGESIATNFAPSSVFNYSRADVIALAGQVTVTHCGGPKFEFSTGRIDAPETPFKNLVALPDDFKDSYESIKKRLVDLGLNGRDIVALVTGSHTLGGVHRAISPHATNQTFEAFDETPGIFDNNIFQRSLENNCRLRVDCSIAADPELRPIVEEFANDEQSFFTQYKISYQKMTAVGANLLNYVHLDIPLHKNLREEGTIGGITRTTTQSSFRTTTTSSDPANTSTTSLSAVVTSELGSITSVGGVYQVPMPTSITDYSEKTSCSSEQTLVTDIAPAYSEPSTADSIYSQITSSALAKRMDLLQVLVISLFWI
jgi:hypothetical protein